MTKPEHSVAKRQLFPSLKSVCSLFILSLVIFLSKGSSLAFDPYDPDPLSLERYQSGLLEPDEITPPLLTIKVLEDTVSEKKPAASLPQVAAQETAEDFESEFAPDDPEITRGFTGGMNASITFDGGGYESGDEAKAILATLRERGIKTTIFLTGMFIRKYPAIVREMVKDGHEIGNHTMYHPHLTDFNQTLRHNTLGNVDRSFVARELDSAAELFRAATGAEMAPLWRAPYGEINKEIRRWAYEAGYIHVGWTYDAKKRESLDTLDWVYDRNSRLYRTSWQIKDRVLNFGKDSGGIRGGIILMHLGTMRKDDRASDALGEMLDGLMAKGYRFVPVSEQIYGTGLLKAVKSKKIPTVKGMAKLNARPDDSKGASGDLLR
ncbi:MAG: polysaccharide deacetylase family protein [Deltaproteobacteria bacterium]|nr:polysaccharide deacetylase family protein [Deltaproteobacteria bacterium]